MTGQRGCTAILDRGRNKIIVAHILLLIVGVSSLLLLLKVGELEAQLVGGGEVGEVLEVVRGDKERLEQQLCDVTQQLQTAREQLVQLQDKLQVRGVEVVTLRWGLR